MLIYKALAYYMQHALDLMSVIQHQFSDKTDRSMKSMSWCHGLKQCCGSFDGLLGCPTPQPMHGQHA